MYLVHVSTAVSWRVLDLVKFGPACDTANSNNHCNVLKVLKTRLRPIYRESLTMMLGLG